MFVQRSYAGEGGGGRLAAGKVNGIRPQIPTVKSNYSSDLLPQEIFLEGWGVKVVRSWAIHIHVPL